jgi:hypothetical protein
MARKLTEKQEAFRYRQLRPKPVKVRPRRDPLARDCYVYLLIDPRDGLPFYAGKGRGQRYLQHVARAPALADSLKLSRIADIHRDDLQVQYAFVARKLTQDAALRLERLVLRHFEGTLTNVSMGQMSEAELGLQLINRAIARVKSPTRWVREWFKEFGRMPTLDEMNGYTDLHLSHLYLRRQCRLALMDDDASSRQPTA